MKKGRFDLAALSWLLASDRSESLKELASLHSILVRAECSETEVTFSVLTESFARCAYDAEAVKEGIEEFPAAHVVGALKPDVR